LLAALPECFEIVLVNGVSSAVPYMKGAELAGAIVRTTLAKKKLR
jgi:hypothetical protein